MALTVEDLYRQYAGRESDPSGKAFWEAGFGETIDANEVASFINAVAQARAQGTEPAATTVAPQATEASTAPMISMFPPNQQRTCQSIPGKDCNLLPSRAWASFIMLIVFSSSSKKNKLGPAPRHAACSVKPNWLFTRL